MRRTSSWFAFFKMFLMVVLSWYLGENTKRLLKSKVCIALNTHICSTGHETLCVSGKTKYKRSCSVSFSFRMQNIFLATLKVFVQNLIWTKNVKKINGQIDCHRYPGALFKLGPEYNGEQKIINR